MAKSGLTHIDVGPELSRTEWESEETHALINGTSFPGSPVERQLFYRNDLHEWYIYTGSAWASLQGAGGGLVVHDNAFHTPDYEEEGVAATQIETHRTAAEHTQDQPSNFLKLSDTPAAFTGQAGKYPKVNVGESALEFDTPGGAGDMLKSVYDTDDDGVVDDSEKLEGSTKVEVQTHNPATHGNEAHSPDFAEDADLDAHIADEAAPVHGSTAAATANKLMHRDASGRAKVAAPAASGDVLIKGTAITDVEHGSRGSALHTDSHARSHDHSSADDGTPIAVAGVPALPASKITSGRFPMARIPDGTSGWFLKAQGAGVDPVYASVPGGGDMLKSVYDPNDDAVLALAQLDPLVCSEAEADAKVSAHAAVTATHGATGAVVGTTNSQTLTNKTLIATTNVVEQITSAASAASPTPTGGSLRNFYSLTALAEAAEFQAPSGTPANANRLIIRIKDDATARALTWNAIYRAMEFALPTTTVISKTLYVGFIYNSADSKWDMVAVNQEA